jgi:hypothetical protein
LARREKLSERSAFGLLGLNAGSIVAMFSAWASLGAIGIDKATLGSLFVTMLVGMGAAVLSIFFETNHVTGMAAEEYRRLSHFWQTETLLEMPPTTENLDLLGELVASLNTVNPKDFSYSPAALVLLNLAGGCWMASACVIAFKVISHSF